MRFRRHTLDGETEPNPRAAGGLAHRETTCSGVHFLAVPGWPSIAEDRGNRWFIRSSRLGGEGEKRESPFDRSGQIADSAEVIRAAKFRRVVATVREPVPVVECTRYFTKQTAGRG